MKLIKFLLLFAIVFGSINSMDAQQRPPGGPAKVNNKIRAKRVIRRTAAVIVKAHKLTKENKVYTGNLAKAVRHQRYAKHLYKKGNFVRAIHQSRLARKYAFLAIKANKGTVDKKDDFDKEDTAGNDKEPNEEELVKELPQDNATVTDQDLINEEISDIDLSDNE